MILKAFHKQQALCTFFVNSFTINLLNLETHFFPLVWNNSRILGDLRQDNTEIFSQIGNSSGWKVPVFEVFLVCIFPHSVWIRRFSKNRRFIAQSSVDISKNMKFKVKWNPMQGIKNINKLPITIYYGSFLKRAAINFVSCSGYGQFISQLKPRDKLTAFLFGFIYNIIHVS